MHVRRLVLLTLVTQIFLCFSGAALVHASTIQQAAGFPFDDGFESGLGNWLTEKTANGIVESNTIYPHTGTQSIFLGQKLAGDASASLILAIDLSGQADVFLDFWTRATGDYAYRRVYISDNSGTTWKLIRELNTLSQSFNHEILDIASAATANGLTLNSSFRILFYYDNYTSKANDGFIIDDVRLTKRAQEISTFPLAQDDFEADVFQQGFYPQSTVGGVAELSTSYAHSGVKSVFLGQKLAGDASASLIVAVDLSGQGDVFLDFWTRATGDYAYRRVYISDNGGTTWKLIRELNTTSQNFSHEFIDIASAATANGLALNNNFRILFFYDNYTSKANDGFVIDDVRLTQRAQGVASFPLALDSFEAESFQQGFYPSSTAGGVAELSMTYPHSGAKSVFLGQKVAGDASAALVLAVDLSGQNDVLLDFWARATGEYAYRGVSISDNGGTTWKLIRKLDTTSQSFSHEILNVSAAATANGLALNKNFRILFYYDNYTSKANDGLVIDDVKLIKTSISGRVYNEAVASGNEVAGAFVQICSNAGCQTTISQDDGSYQFGDLPAGAYNLRVLPPARNNHLIGALGPIALTDGASLTEQNIILPKATGIPVGTSVSPALPAVEGVPTINWTTSVLLTHKGCASGTATYQVYVNGAVAREGTMIETPAGIYSVTLAPFRPVHGNIQLLINIRCPSGTQPPPINFNIWIDPSGFVVNTFGAPLAAAKVSLYRSETTDGPFELVTSGSAVMSPANRLNPMTTDSTGRFGWDVIAGYYRVRAEKTGCTAPDSTQTFNETAVLTIPPPVTDLRIILDCGEAGQVFLPIIRR